MITMVTNQVSLIERLPRIRGQYSTHVSLARCTWFRVGGFADVQFLPADEEDLANFLANKPDDVPVTIIGAGSNILVRDGGVKGVVVRLPRSFATIKLNQETAQVYAGAGAMDINVARACRDASISGLEYLSGIPGTIGGALRMNAGAYGRDMSTVTLEAKALDNLGQPHLLYPGDLGFSYRCTHVSDDWIFTSILMQGEPGERREIMRRMDEIRDARHCSQPVKNRTGGSTFVNPEDAVGAAAWELIERAGCRGLKRGGAKVSDSHCNFLINTGTATAADLEVLGDEVRRRVVEETGVHLEWEIQRIGSFVRDELVEVER